MSKKELFDEIEDIIPILQKSIIPFIQEGTEAVTKAYSFDSYLSPYSFGCMLWDDLTSRFFSAKADLLENDIEIRRRRHVNIITVKDGIDLHYHRVDEKSSLPSGAKSVKNSITSTPKVKQMALFSANYENYPDNIILAIDANYEEGLNGVFIGLLEADQSKKKGYEWEKTFPVYLADEISLRLLESSNSHNIVPEAEPTVFIQNETLQPDEKDPDNIVSLDEYKQNKENIESDGKK